MFDQPKQIAQIAIVTLLILGCLFVVYPFVAAILFAAVLCITTWPAFARLKRLLRGRATLAAALMTLALTLLVLLPMVALSASAIDAISHLVGYLKLGMQGGLGAPPEWLQPLPLVGDSAYDYWQRLAGNRDELLQLLRQGVEPARNALLLTGSLIGQGVLQLSLVLFIGFFFYRDGPALADLLAIGARKLGGDIGIELLQLSRNTVTGVMIGIVGTALGQALVALIGFLIAGVPAPLLLAAATFFLSMVPVGPPLIWGGAALWLYNQGESGWAIFMVAYGVLAISSVDNFLKPLLISRSASLPILLIALGVFGGILAFGFIGIFLGPTLLALGHMLWLRWTGEPPAAIAS
jgi:predicted PurR-regulated permease PerM